MQSEPDSLSWQHLLYDLRQHLSRLPTAEDIPPDDALRDCGCAVLRRMYAAGGSASVRELAYSKLSAWPYNDVPFAWRRAYEEASLLELRERLRYAEMIDLDGIVTTLDMIIILSGAPDRRALIDRLLECLHTYLDQAPETPYIPESFIQDQPFVPSPSSTIPKHSEMALYDFQLHVGVGGGPLILTNIVPEWPAYQLWCSPRYLWETALRGRRLVPVELGRSYTDERWGQSIMSINDYMVKYLLSPNAEDVGYIAQHDLLDQIPQLSNDTRYPDYCFVEMPPPNLEVAQLESPARNIWIGPAGTITDLHTDPYHNILCQVVGRKYVRLYSPRESRKLYPRGTDDAGISMDNTSQVDVSLARKAEAGCPDATKIMEAKFPLFTTAKYVDCVLEAGQALYIPEGWWHYVESLEVSYNVSYWFN